MVHEIETDAEYVNKVSEQKGLVVVDFYAQWCGPCKKFSSRYQKLSEEFTDVKFYKVDVEVEELSNVVKEEQISAMPTFVVYKDGLEVGRVVGVDENKLVKLIDLHKN